jgi:hypothetical protein
MDDVTSERATRVARERQSGLLFAATALSLAVAAGAMQVAGWSGGSLDNRIEPLFWVGAILAAAGTACLGVGAVPWVADDRRAGRLVAGLLRVGMLLFLVGPVLAVIAVFRDYWI